MRVIAGLAKGHKLVAPKTDATRPALDRVKEAIFSILFDVRGLRVLDLFAGSGSMGIEALSRGAAHCTFVEHLRAAVTCIHKNLHRCHFMEKAEVLAMGVNAAIDRLDEAGQGFDLLFLDPPYERQLVNPTLTRLAEASLMAANGLIVIEHHPHEPITTPPGFVLTDERQYGQTHVSFLTNASPSP